MISKFGVSFQCPICDEVSIYTHSESGLAGACARCRDRIIPKYIPLEQQSRYLKLLKERNDTEKRYTKRNYKIL